MAESPGWKELALARELQAKLTAERSTVLTMIKKWDTNKDRQISLQEFLDAVNAMNLPDVDEATIEGLFDFVDEDKSKSVNFKEMSKLFSVGKTARTGKDFLKESAEKNKEIIERSKPKEAEIDDTPLDRKLGDDETAMLRQLQEILAKNRSNVAGMLRTWDTDGDGQVSEEEFIQAVLKLGKKLGVSKNIDEDEEEYKTRVSEQITPVAQTLFRSVDVDGSGTVEFTEMAEMFKFQRPTRTAEEYLEESRAKDALRIKKRPKKQSDGKWTNYYRKYMDELENPPEEADDKANLADHYDLVKRLQDKLAEQRWTVATFLHKSDPNKDGKVEREDFAKTVLKLLVPRDPKTGDFLEEADSGPAEALFDTLDSKTQDYIGLHELSHLFRTERQFRSNAEFLAESMGKHQFRADRAKSLPPRMGWESSMTKKSHNQVDPKTVPFGTLTNRDHFSGWIAQYVSTTTSNKIGPGSYPEYKDEKVSFSVSDDDEAVRQLIQVLQAKYKESKSTVRNYWRRYDRDFDHKVNQEEFSRAVQEITIAKDTSLEFVEEFDSGPAEALFQLMDSSGSGYVDFRTLSAMYGLDRPTRSAKDFLKEASAKKKNTGRFRFVRGV